MKRQRNEIELALYQMKMSRSIEENKVKSILALQKAAVTGADLIVFPEIQLCPFFPQYEKKEVSQYAMILEDSFVKELREACRKNKIMAAPNIYLLEKGYYYDATLLISKSGDILGIQKMVHIAQAEQFYEQDYYEPSDDGFHVFETEYGNIGIVICFDRHYPESIRTETLIGADLILIPTANTKAEPMEMFEWEIRTQAFQNSVAIAMCNRVGMEDQMHFSGESLVIDANGTVMAKANDQEKILYTEIDIRKSREIRAKRPYTSLRRKEWYI